MAAKILGALIVGIYLLIATQEAGQVAVIFDQTPLVWQGLAAICISLVAGFCLSLLSRSTEGWREQLGLFILPSLLLTQRIMGWTGLGAITLVCILAISVIFCLWAERSKISRVMRLKILGGAILIGVSIHLLLRIDLVRVSRETGVLLLIVLFISLAAIFIMSVLRKRRVGPVILTAALLSFIFNELSHDVERFSQYPAEHIEPPETVASFKEWLLSRKDLPAYVSAGKAYPVFLVASEGGGGYAAAHSHLYLSKLQARCKNFIQHTFALVGVSGGAVGNTQFHATLNGNQNIDQPSGCSEFPESDDNVVQKLKIDHLSPVIGAMLFQDAPNKIMWGILGGRDRAGALTLSLEQGIRQSGAQAPGKYLDHFWDKSARPNFLLSGGPALIHVATNSISGMRFVFAPFIIGNEAPDRRREEALRVLNMSLPFDIHLLDAAVASASFPWITPSLRLLVGDLPLKKGGRGTKKKPDQKYINLVDGGYLDNSGAETVSDILAELMDLEGDEGKSQTEVASNLKLRLGLQKECDDVSMLRIQYVGPENSIAEKGKAAIRDLKERIRNVEKKDGEFHEFSEDPCVIKFKVHAVIIRAEAPEGCYAPSQNFLFDPVNALLNTRQRRGETARYGLLSAFCGSPTCSKKIGGPDEWQYSESVIDTEFMTLPLGWYMPEQGLQKIYRTVVPKSGEKIKVPPDGSLADKCDGLSYSRFGTMKENPDRISELLSKLARPTAEQ